MGALVEIMRYTHHDRELDLATDTLGVRDDGEGDCDGDDKDFGGLVMRLGFRCLTDRNVADSSLTISNNTSNFGKFATFLKSSRCFVFF